MAMVKQHINRLKDKLKQFYYLLLGHSVCNGDSGGGLFFTDGLISHLRGIVSIGAKKLNEFVCDTDHRAVFTDVSYFLNWIDNNKV